MNHNNSRQHDRTDQSVFQLSLVTLEHTMMKPLPSMDHTTCAFFNNRTVLSVPVIHIYGSTPAGQKTCLHVHKCLPYFFIPFRFPVVTGKGVGTNNNPISLEQQVRKQHQSFAYHLAVELERVMEQKRLLQQQHYYRQNQSNNNNSNNSRNQPRQYIHDVVLVRGIPFYGYWQKQELFMKVFVYNPSDVKKMADILQSGSIMRQKFQPYEVHIPYPLQFMIDHNIYGMGQIQLRKAYFRVPLPVLFQPDKLMNPQLVISPDNVKQNESDDISSANKLEGQERTHLYLKDTVPIDMWLSGRIDRLSYSDLEVDALDEDILNILQISNEPIQTDNHHVSLVQSLSVIWEEERSRRKTMGMPSHMTSATPSQPRSSPIITEIQNAMISRLSEIVREEEAITSTEQDSTHPKLLEQYPASYELYCQLACPTENDLNNKLTETEFNNVNDDDLEMLDILDWMKEQEEDEQIDINDPDEWELNDIGEIIDRQSYEHEEQIRSQQESKDILQSYYEETQNQREEEELIHKQSLSDLAIPQLDGIGEESIIFHDSTPKKKLKISYSIGHCVYLRPPEYKQGEELYVGLIESISGCQTTVKIRWFLRPQELPRGNEYWHSSNELFISNMSDENSIGAIVSLVSVKLCSMIEQYSDLSLSVGEQLPHLELGDDVFVCRLAYDTLSCQYVSIPKDVERLLGLYEGNDQDMDDGQAAVLSRTNDSGKNSNDSPQEHLREEEQQEARPTADELFNGFGQRDPETERDKNEEKPRLDESSILDLSPEQPEDPPSKILHHSFVTLNYNEIPPTPEDKTIHKKVYYSRHTDYVQGDKASTLRFRGLGLSKKQVFPRSMDDSALPFYKPKSTSVERRRIDQRDRTMNSCLLCLEYSLPPPIRSVVCKPSELIIESKEPEPEDMDLIDHPPSPKWDEAMGFTSTITQSGSIRNALNFSQIPATLKAPSQDRVMDKEVKALNANFVSPVRMRKAMTYSPLSAPEDTSMRVQNAQKTSRILLKQKNQLRQSLSCLSIEIHTTTRMNLRPNPMFDPIEAIFFSTQRNAQEPEYNNGILMVEHEDQPRYNEPCECLKFYPSEKALLIALIDLIQSFDPDIVLGFEAQTQSLGYIIERSSVILGYNVCKKISRAIHKDLHNEHLHFRDEWGRMKQSGIHIRGRIVMNVWRAMRYEAKLNIYSFENVMFHVLGRRVPHLSYQTRTTWYMVSDTNNTTLQHRSTIIQYYEKRTKANLELLYHLDFVNRTAQLAKVYGIEFFSVISRGSQYKVESMMIRLAKPRNYVMMSPSREQVRQQNAIECIPLVMEPSSKLYSNPVIVLDFQSLYPSIIIAYNLCFSTCLGKVEHKSTKRLGALQNYILPKGALNELKNDILIAPNRVMYVKDSVRPGVLPRMLREILDTRVMIKRAMQSLKTQDLPAQEKEIMYRNLNARQYGLKMLANVTYGYASASYSGRMPMSDLADSIVQIGRCTLEQAIQTVSEQFSRYGARVVYGDTDSLFVEMVGASRERAFEVGKKIAEAVTAQNPHPMKLQFEKVFHPCMLVTKKRYVGYSYESAHQKEPIFTAKGIETVRRDNCGIVGKMMEKCLRIAFETKNVSEVKQYCVQQWDKILRGRISLKDFVFAKEVKFGTYSERGTLPPAAIVAQEEMKKDARAEPLYAERIPYLVVYGDPDARLIDMVMNPHRFLELEQSGKNIRIHSTYYITKQIIPALDRLFSLIGVDVKSWYNEMSKKSRFGWKQHAITGRGKKHQTLDAFYGTRFCLVCESGIINYRKISKNGINEPSLTDVICRGCLNSSQLTSVWLHSRYREVDNHQRILNRVCSSCLFGSYNPSMIQQCDSLDCKVMYVQKRTTSQLKSLNQLFDHFSVDSPEDWF